MNIESLKDLEKVLKLARKLGVTTMKVDNIEFQLGSIPERSKRSDFTSLELPPEANIPVPQYQVSSEAEKILTEELTQEQLLMWSARPEDPIVKEQ